MDNIIYLKIKGDKDKIAVAGVLIANGYKVSIINRKENNKQVRYLMVEPPNKDINILSGD